jgi:hypothetical protein
MKQSRTLTFITSIILVASVSTVWAMPNLTPTVATVNPSGRTVVIPAHAIEVADHVFSLGTSVDPQTGKVVEGFAIVHPRRGYHHRDGHGGGPGGGGPPGGGGGSTKCYAFLAKDAKWKSTESFLLNPANTEGMSDSFVEKTIDDAVDTWDSEVATDIFGARISTSDPLSADTVSPDGDNEVYFGSISDPGAIAVTITWGIFSGKPSNRELLEWDMVYDQDDFVWGDADVDPLVMDLGNVATHEVGHAGGMGHPEDTCTEETMYRFATEGETKKRDLNAGDIAGINDLY